MSDQFFPDGTQFVDCSKNSNGITLQQLVEMLRFSEIDLPIRFDEVLISPTAKAGKLCLKLEITNRMRRADDDEMIDEVFVLTSA